MDAWERRVAIVALSPCRNWGCPAPDCASHTPWPNPSVDIVRTFRRDRGRTSVAPFGPMKRLIFIMVDEGRRRLVGLPRLFRCPLGLCHSLGVLDANAKRVEVSGTGRDPGCMSPITRAGLPHAAACLLGRRMIGCSILFGTMTTPGRQAPLSSAGWVLLDLVSL